MGKWLDGAGVPSRDIGFNDDYYLNISNGDIFKKLNSLWIRIGCIKGRDGEKGKEGLPGKDGLNGKDGSEGKNANSWYDGVGEPEPNFGNVDDYYLNIQNADIFKKESVYTWKRIGRLAANYFVTLEEYEEQKKNLISLQNKINEIEAALFLLQEKEL